MDKKRKIQASANFKMYLHEGLLKKEANPLAEERYIENAELSLNTAYEIMKSPLKPYLWVIVISYYSMFYIANAVLLHHGYKTQERIAHKVTCDALIALVLDRMKVHMLEDFEDAQQDAMEIISARAESIIESFSFELAKRSRFQYNMLEESKEEKAKTSLERAKIFLFEMRKLL